ncbi:MAG TPA: response regulator [Candidatus Limnocylindria bacterium]|jgi:CheY-like chemotaxis protein|nr:response regulator [Candidatus Limnocylindria bacterium]
MPHLLLIDDDDSFRRMLRLTLEQAGHTVTEAKDGREGLMRYQPAIHDLVITDLIMPEKEGLETIAGLRRRHAAVRIIAMSGGGRYSPNTYLSTAKALGASLLFAKPFAAGELLVGITDLLASPPQE